MEWKEVRLGDSSIFFVDGDRGKNYPKKNEFSSVGYCLFLNASNVTKNGFVFQDNAFISKLKDDSLRKGKLQYGDIVLTTRGTVGNVAFYNSSIKYANVRINSGMVIIRHGLDFDTEYLYHYIKSSLFQNQIIQFQSGSAQPQLPISTLNKMKVLQPPIDTQRRIASILSSLDRKIELNNKINAQLEEMAQVIFKSWFVDFEPFKDDKFVESELGLIPEGWRVFTLNDITSKFGTGLNPRKNFKLGEGDNFYVTIKNMGNNRIYLDEKCDKVTDEAIEIINKRSKLKKGDLLFSGIGTIGRVALITEDPKNWNTSESVFNLHPSENVSSEFLYLLLLSDVFQTYVKQNAQGGVQQGIRMASLKEYTMPLPDNEILRKFDSIIIPIITRIKENDKENDTLAQLRDTLLPKLMNGEIEI